MINIFGKPYTSFSQWFSDKTHPHSKIEGHHFLMDSLWLIASIILFLVFYNNAVIFNQIVILFIRLGAVIELVLLYFIIRKAYFIIKNLIYGFRGLNNGLKAGLLLILILICSIIYANQESFTNWALGLYQNFDFASFNPFRIN